MDSTTDLVVSLLNAAVRSDEAATYVEDVLARVTAKLAASHLPVAVALELVPLAVFGVGLPEAVRSALVMVTRPDTEGGSERHPERRQWSYTLSGTGAFEVEEGDEWTRYEVADGAGPRWVSIPPTAWYSEAGGERPWGTLSFYTCYADELFSMEPADPDGL